MRGSEERFRSLVRHASDIITVLEADGTIRFESPAVEKTLGYYSEEMVGKNIFDYIHPDDREEAFGVFSLIMDGPEELPPLQCRFRHADGYWKYLEAVGSNQLENPSVAGIVCNCRDITERKVLEEQIEHRAFHDSLTNLPNRTLFLDRLSHALTRVERRPKPLAVLFLDLGNFKVVNDSLGHEAGDQLLIEFARRLQERLRPEDTAARFGGDEFAVLLDDLTYMSDVTRVVERIVESLEAPFFLDETSREVFVTASIGVAGRLAEEGPKDLLRAADLAMYEAKGSGKARYAVFDPILERQVHERLELEGDLRRALARGEIKVYYQPQARLDTEEIVGVEALARWENPERGMILPEKFIPLAEETGLIVPLGRFVLEEACRQLKVWHERHPRNPPLTMSVNLSTRQFRDPTLTGEVLNTLKETNLAPETLVLEITESAAVEDAKSAISMLETIRELGVKIAIDDFGKGYSSLSYLRRLPVDSVKIDRSMIERIETDAGDWAIVSSSIMLAHTLKLEAVAEGVESPGQARELRTLRCDTGQGYYWWKPGPAETIAALLTSQDEGYRSSGQPAGSGKI